MFLLTDDNSYKRFNFHYSIKKVKYLGKNLAKDVQYLYNVKCKSLMTENKKDVTKWRDKQCSWTIILNIFKIATLPSNLNYALNAISIMQIDKLILKVILNKKKKLTDLFCLISRIKLQKKTEIREKVDI